MTPPPPHPEPVARRRRRARLVRSALGWALPAASGALLAGIAAMAPRAASADPPPAGEPSSAPAAHLRCNRQAAQPFLIRTNYVPRGNESREQRRARHAAHDRAIRYRTERYGYFEGFGEPSWNRHPPRFYATSARFMGLPVVMHRRVVPALACAEQEIRRACSHTPYRPRHLAGIRFENTYHTGEITNHAYGIAIDIDPERNTCCGCVGRWAEHPLCRRPARTVWERMAMPECWVDAFERYGFYWLGHDPMHDTMHFEFLGDPDRITP